MIKKLTIMTICLSAAVGLSASPLTPEQALMRLQSEGPVKTNSLSKSSLKLAYTAKSQQGVASAYVFTPENGEGFTILSADDMAVPVLGYSFTERFDADNLPPALIGWLDQLGQRIENAQKENTYANSSKVYAPASMSAIAPLLKTTWDQEAPYNNLTPVMQGQHTPTGCVATAFAQVMNYFKYPQRGEGTITYTDKNTRRTMTFTKDFDWANMLDSYVPGQYNDTQAEAVAYLMKACGFSVEMNYDVEASGAISYKLVNAAVNYFKYDAGTYYTERENYSLDQWMQMIYDNLKNVGPVIYDGQSMIGGHSFVCDGYDGNGYFHFNWGWSGLSDGYYILDALNPESQGVGGSEGGFNYVQGALLGMKPATGEASRPPLQNMKIFGNAVASLDNGVINFKAVDGGQYTGWGNASYVDLNLSIGAIFSNLETGETVSELKGYLQFTAGGISSVVTLKPTGYWPAASANPSVTLPMLPDGKYKVTIATRDNNVDDAPWQPIVTAYGNVNYCYLTVENGQASVTSASPAKLTFENSVINTPVYYGRNVRFVSTITNNSDMQLTVCYFPALARNGAVQYLGDFMLITVNPGETIEKTAFTTFYEYAYATNPGLGEYDFVFVDSSSGLILGQFGKYNLEMASGTLTLELDNFSIENAPQETVTYGSQTFKDAYVLNNLNTANILLDYTVTQGYFDTNLKIMGAKFNPDTNKFENFDNEVLNEIPFTGAGSTENVVVPLNCLELEEGFVYRLAAGYSFGSTTKSLGIIYFKLNSTGVEIIDADASDILPVYYNLQGVRINEPVKGQLVIRKLGSKTDKIIF